MGFLSKFEGKMEDTFEGAADKMFDAPISPVQIAKKAEKQMRREKMVGAGKQYAPTLYTVLVNPDDDQRLFGYYPTLAGETETYLTAKASEQGLVMDGQPLVRFIVDENLKHGKFDIIAEAVAAPIIAQLRAEEMQRYGLASSGASAYGAVGYGAPGAGGYAPAPPYSYDEAPQPFAAQGYDQPAAGYGAPQGYAPQQGYAQPQDYAAQQGYAQPQDYAPQHYAPEQQGYAEEAPGYAASGYPINDPDSVVDYGAFSFDGAAGPAAGAPVAAAAAAGAVAGAASAQPAMAANTVMFAGGAQGAAPVPSRTAVRARLVDTTNNRSYDLATSRLLIGRESKNDIVVADINASRTHAELRFEPQGVWVLSDLGSTNGTFVNGAEISAQPLREGDRITVGTTNLVFTQA